MDLIALGEEISSLPPYSHPQNLFASKIRLGELLEGYVLESKEGPKVRVNFKDISLWANTQIPLNPGEKILVRVKQLTPFILLQLLSPERNLLHNKLSSLLKIYLPEQVAWGELFKELTEGLRRLLTSPDSFFNKPSLLALSNLLSTLIFGEEQKKNPFYFQNFVRQSGLLYEAQLVKLFEESFGLIPFKFFLKDLKGVLLKLSSELKDFMEGNPGITPGRLDTFIPKAFSLLKNIELNQVINLIRQEEDLPYIFQIPLIFPEEIEEVKLYIYSSKEGFSRKTKKEQFKLVFLFTLSGLGYMEIQVKIQPKKIDLEIGMEKEEGIDFIQPFLSQLKERLLSLGYLVEKIVCTQIKKEFLSGLEVEQSFSRLLINLIDIEV